MDWPEVREASGTTWHSRIIRRIPVRVDEKLIETAPCGEFRMKPEARKYFDEQLEIVLGGMPPRVHNLLDEVPLLVEDHPSSRIMHELGVRRRHHLCGLYTGIPLTQRSIDQSGVPSDVIYVFREGVIGLATDRHGRLDEAELRRQIRITVLHELGHHHGLGEEELERLGY